MRVVAVRFHGNSGYGSPGVYNSKEYFYYTYFDVKEGDKVVVDTSTNGLSVAEVSDANVTSVSNIGKATKYLVQKVDLVEYEKRIQSIKELKDLKKKMDAKVKEIQDVALYKLLSAEDSELADMFKSYETLLSNM